MQIQGDSLASASASASAGHSDSFPYAEQDVSRTKTSFSEDGSARAHQYNEDVILLRVGVDGYNAKRLTKNIFLART